MPIVPDMPIEIDHLVWRERLGRALAEARTSAGYTQESAAPELKVDKQTISNWERGRHDIRLFDVVRVAVLYEMPSEWIVEPPEGHAELVGYRERRRQEREANGGKSIAQRRAETTLLRPELVEAEEDLARHLQHGAIAAASKPDPSPRGGARAARPASRRPSARAR